MYFFFAYRPASQSSLFHAWETFLQEIEADSQSTSDVASALSRQVMKYVYNSRSLSSVNGKLIK